MNKKNLIHFEKEVGDIFNRGEIRAPIHLYSGNEEQVIKVFRKINNKNDWVCCTWRNHYQALLKDIPVEIIKQQIMNGKSMVMNLPQYKFICSSIVGGIPSIATGIAVAAKLRNTKERVWCWVGDMSAETGAWAEAYKYSVAQDLPITFIIEDNKQSVLTPTHEMWGDSKWYLPSDCEWYEHKHLIYYKYNNSVYPHAGAGIRVQF